MKQRTEKAPLHPLARIDAPFEQVRKSNLMRAFHADRFEKGASDDLAIAAWSDYMAERQRLSASSIGSKARD